MSSHLIDGKFQSDKYPTTPLGKVLLSVEDPAAQDLLWEYAQRRRSVDAEFSDDLETALKNAGYKAPLSCTCGADEAGGMMPEAFGSPAHDENCPRHFRVTVTHFKVLNGNDPK